MKAFCHFEHMLNTVINKEGVHKIICFIKYFHASMESFV